MMHYFKVLKDKLYKFSIARTTKPIYDSALFIVITLVVHFTFRYWSASSNFHLFGWQVLSSSMFDAMAKVVYIQSKWILHFFIPFQSTDSSNMFIFTNNFSFYVNGSCSGFKPLLQFTILMLLFPGQWKHKLWYIPLGLIIVHITNLIRIVSLGLIMHYNPDSWHFAHRYPLRIMFYVVIFLLWIVWNEYIRQLKTEVEAKR